MEHTAAVFSSIVSSRTRPDRELEITLADEEGRPRVVRVSAELAANLAKLLSDFAAPMLAASNATKRPRSFAVGTGLFEPVVLLRFEDDIPYGVSPEQAAELARALVEEAEEAARRPVPARN